MNCWIPIHSMNKVVFTQGDFKRGFQKGISDGRFQNQANYLTWPQNEIPSDRKNPIKGQFHFGPKLNAYPGFEIAPLKSPI